MDVVVRVGVDPARAELAALELWDNGATAVEERDGELLAAFPTPAAARVVAERLGADVVEVPDGWQDAWRAHARAVTVADRVVVAPAWKPVPVMAGRLVVPIDSGSCFGSGSHPSTRLIVGLLAATPPAGAAVVDVGTGSGILAVVAALLGAASVVAVDVEPEAIEVTDANAGRNGVSDVISASLTPVAALDGPYDLALVNLTAGVHAEVAADVLRTVRPGGRLYLAGLLPGQWEHVAGAYAGGAVVELPELDGWQGAVLSRR